MQLGCTVTITMTLNPLCSHKLNLTSHKWFTIVFVNIPMPLLPLNMREDYVVYHKRQRDC